VNGSDPTSASPLYTAPLSIGGGLTTLKARAFQADWTPSAAITETYSVDVTPPSLTAQVWPSATTAGWNNGDVTIKFVCADTSGVSSCPSPVVLDQEGAGQVVSRTIQDTWGHETTLDVTINIDRTAPEVVLAGPTDGLTTTDTSVTLTAEVAGALSGIATAACNGLAATVTGGQVECVVPLQPGRNTIALFARDTAGNGTSAAVRVIRTGTASTLRLDPGIRTMLVGDSQTFTSTDNYGVIVSASTWESSDTNVATVDSTGLVTAVAEGDATITATVGSLTANATVTVLTGTSLPYGTTRWSVAPTAGLTMLSPIYTHRVDQTVPDLFSVEGDESVGDGAYVVRAMTASGNTLWTEQAPGVPVMGDAFGGVIAKIRDSDFVIRGLARFGGPATALPWRYDSTGHLWTGTIAQAPDGTIYALEWLPGTPVQATVPDVSILVLNGATGASVARIPLERQVETRNVTSGCEDELGTHLYEQAPQVGQVIVGANGDAHLLVMNADVTFTGRCRELNPGQDFVSEHVTMDVKLRLYRVTPEGEVSTDLVSEYHFDGASHPNQFNPWELALARQLLPDSLGGMIATWSSTASGYQWNATRFDASGQRADYLLSTGVPSGTNNATVALTGDDGTAYVQAYPGGPTTAVDVRTWTTKWTSSATGKPVMALADGGVALDDPLTNTLAVVDGSGVATQMTSTQQTRPTSALRFGTWEGIAAGTLTSLAGMELHESRFSYQNVGGNSSFNFAPRTMHDTIHQAAIAALRYYNPFSIERNREFAASICLLDARYYASFPNEGIYSDTVEPTICGPGTRFGEYHTHARHGNAGFSGPDIARVDNDSYAGYWMHHFVATPCGDIYNRRGPSGTVDVHLAERTDTPLASCLP
jgi:uncharacterized protein YjdB